MLTKIIVTLLVIVGCLWYASSKREQSRQPTLVIASKEDQQRNTMLQRGTYLFMFIQSNYFGSSLMFFDINLTLESFAVY